MRSKQKTLFGNFGAPVDYGHPVRAKLQGWDAEHGTLEHWHFYYLKHIHPFDKDASLAKYKIKKQRYFNQFNKR